MAAFVTGAVAASGRLPACKEMAVQRGSDDWRDRKVREWLLLLLRFAVTREPADHCAVLAMADELDSVSARWRPAAPSFFRRTSHGLCEALLAAKDGNNDAILRRHMMRIDDPRLRNAFQAAAGLRQPSEARQQGVQGRKRKTRDLWKGLRSKK